MWTLIGIVTGVVLLFLVIMGLVMAKLYKRTTKRMAFVRTGSGGQKVVKDGGAVIIPILHEVIEVAMETLTVVVKRNKDSALITKDKLRVDVEAEFYLRVKPDDEGIATAAQTLGTKTMNKSELQDLVEGKFIDALRAVAAKMDMNELHENRSDFVTAVQKALFEDLDKNGLELETVSLTGLDQTSMEFFNPNNAFDAEGLKKLTEITEKRRMERNKIEKDAEIAIAQRNLEAKQRTLQIAQEEASTTAEREREIAEKQAEETKTSELARISAERETEEARIAKDQTIQEAEISKNRALEEQRIGKEKAVEAADIEKAQTIEAAEIGKKKTVDLAEQDRAIAVAQKSEEHSKAKAESERARAEAVTETQTVLTAEATATADRARQVGVITEKAEAEKIAAGTLVAAETERKAAEDKAAAVTIQAEAAANKVTIEAKAEAARVSTMAEAKARDYEVEAAGQEAINAALEKIPQAEREMLVKQALIAAMPNMIAEMAAPIGKIDSIRVLDMRGSGLDGVKGAMSGEVVEGSATTVAGADNLPAQVVDSLMKYKVSMPLLEKLASEIGVDLTEGFGGLTKSLGIGDDSDDSVDVETPKPAAKRTTKKTGAA